MKRAPKPPPPADSSITRMSPDLTYAPVIVGIEAVNSPSSIARPIPVPIDRCILLSCSDELLRLACRRCLLRVCPARASSIVHISADEAAIARKTPIKKGGHSLLFKISFRGRSWAASVKFPANLRSLCRLQITLAALISRPPGVATSPRQLCKDLVQHSIGQGTSNHARTQAPQIPKGQRQRKL